MTLTPSKLQYIRPESLEDALNILSREDENLKVLGGGQSLIPLLKTRIVNINKVLDIGNLDALNYIKSGEKETVIGATTRISQIAESEAVKKKVLALHEACNQIADPLVRNMGTIGGNISHADPGNDIPVVVTALDATIVTVGKGGERRVKAEDFFKGPFETSLMPGEIVKEIAFPNSGIRQGSSFIKIRKMSGDFSVSTSASFVSIHEDGAVSSARIAVSSATPVPVRIREMEKYVAGKKIDDDVLQHVREHATDHIEIMEEQTISSDFRKYCTSDAAVKSLERAYAVALGR